MIGFASPPSLRVYLTSSVDAAPNSSSLPLSEWQSHEAVLRIKQTGLPAVPFLDSAGTDWPLLLVEQSVVKAAWLPRIWSCATSWKEPQDTPAGPGKRWLLFAAHIFSFMSAN